MQEIVVKLRFITPCLGNIRRNDCDAFERDASGNVVFRHTAWYNVLAYGAQALSKHQALISQVRSHPQILGVTSTIKRWYDDNAYRRHEGFGAGAEIIARFMLPTGIPTEDFIAILNLAGAYYGLSPYGWQYGYGKFEAEQVPPPPDGRAIDIKTISLCKGTSDSIPKPASE